LLLIIIVVVAVAQNLMHEACAFLLDHSTTSFELDLLLESDVPSNEINLGEGEWVGGMNSRW
jgi:hypothetical protein